ncbi:MAG: O-antigen ligase family protein [Candidatus Spechtbacteria bacterium]|nr:O-antigen ligase family protein [Candidatus Spechtbacteria bacterium]
MPWQKLEAFLAALFIFSLPFETRIVLHATDPFNEWQSVFLYASDVLFVVLLAVGFLSHTQAKEMSSRALQQRGERSLAAARDDSRERWTPWKPGLNSVRKKLFILAVIFFIAVVISTLVGNNHLPGWYHVVKIAEGILLFYYIAVRMPLILPQKKIIWLLVSTGIAQSIIGFAQFAMQSSLGLRIFRESPLVIGDDRVAQIMVNGARMIRAYGTMPSPNVLAGFLSVALFFSFFLFLEYKGNKKIQALIAVCQFVLLCGLFVTFSRGVLLTFLVLSLVVFTYLLSNAQHGLSSRARRERSLGVTTPRDDIQIYNSYKRSLTFLAAIFIIQILFLTILLWPELSARAMAIEAGGEAAVGERYLFNVVGIEAIKQHPLWGVGLGNFTSYFRETFTYLKDSIYQPIHNIYLLIAAESGISAAIIFISFLGSLIGGLLRELWSVRHCKGVYPELVEGRQSRSDIIAKVFLFCTLLFVVLAGMYDHYFWTIQQTNLLFWLVAGLAAGFNVYKGSCSG